MPVDPELVSLLERSATRSVDAVLELRRTIDRDREAEADRFGRLERQVDRYGATLGRLERRIDAVDRKCGALVLEDDGEDGPVYTARPARVGLDAKFVIGLAAALLTAMASSPVLIELIK